MYVDPTGRYICGCAALTPQDCAAFEVVRLEAQRAAGAVKEKEGADSQKYKELQTAIHAYGRAGVDNGVTIEQGKVTPGAAAEAVLIGDRSVVTIPKGTLAKKTGYSLASTVAHEGSHVADQQAAVRSKTAGVTQYETESRACRVGAAVFDGQYYDNPEPNLFEIRPFGRGNYWHQFISDGSLRLNIDAELAIPRRAGGLYGVTPSLPGRRIRR